jgi:cellulose synthase/poly-beta-1,6-N-acetylglucosamine synthase-like glycosyltransferase
MNVYAIVPVAPYEPASQITKSIECFKELKCNNFKLDIYYVIETFPGDKRTLHWELPDNFNVILRNHNRGRRAGAVNDVLREIKNADYVALFDVDNRPADDYIIKCVAALEENNAAISSGGCRFVNNKSNVLTKVISIEYSFLCDMYHRLSRSDSFLTFQGAGVVKGSFLRDEKFDEEVSCDDVDLIARAYLKGGVAVLAKTTMGEQAPSTLKDLYTQRVRWYKADVENINKYLIPMFKAPVPFTRKITWFLVMTVPFLGFLLAPIVILYLGKIKNLSNGPLEFVKIFFGSIGHTWLMTVCGIAAILKHSTSSKFEWGPSIRSDV